MLAVDKRGPKIKRRKSTNISLFCCLCPFSFLFLLSVIVTKWQNKWNSRKKASQIGSNQQQHQISEEEYRMNRFATPQLPFLYSIWFFHRLSVETSNGKQLYTKQENVDGNVIISNFRLRHHMQWRFFLFISFSLSSTQQIKKKIF